MKKYLTIGIILLFIGTATIPSSGQKIEKLSLPTFIGKTIYVDDNNTEGPWNGTLEHPYRTIQDGVNAAVNGDTVFVFDGIYYESVIVRKSINLFGEDKHQTIIDGGSGTETNMVVQIQEANETNISGFTIQNGGSNGVGVEINSNNNTITNNIIGSNHVFCLMIDKEYNTIANNTILSGRDGISLFSKHNIIADNTILCKDIAIDLLDSYNTVIGNTIQNAGAYTIYDEGGGHNVISRNIISNNSYDGITVFESNNDIITNNVIFSNGGSGVAISQECWDNNISGNIITSNSYFGIAIGNGIFFMFDAARTSIYGNIISNNGKSGITLMGRGTKIIGNTISNNHYGILSYSNKINIIEKNNIMNNSVNAFFRYQIAEAIVGITIWNANYWGAPQQKPVLILGRIGVILCILPWLPQFDKNPAQTPYYIPGMNQ
jgi:parallel beta-helix repeat protein